MLGLQTRKASKPAPTTIVRSLTIDLCVENLQTPCRYQFTLFLENHYLSAEQFTEISKSSLGVEIIPEIRQFAKVP